MKILISTLFMLRMTSVSKVLSVFEDFPKLCMFDTKIIGSVFGLEFVFVFTFRDICSFDNSQASKMPVIRVSIVTARET